MADDVVAPDLEQDVDVQETLGIVLFRFGDLRNYTANFARPNLLGRGAFGEVYRGVVDGRGDDLDGTHVAIKASFDKSNRNMWEAEIDLLSRLGGQCCILPLLGKAETDRRLFLVYPLGQGGSLHTRIAGLNWPDSLKIMTGIAEALAFLHSQSPPIFHNDVKSHNILLDGLSNPILADFGMASVEGVPETDDIRQLGILLLQLLMKRPITVNPFNGTTIYDWASAKGGNVAHESLRRTGCNFLISGAVKKIAIKCGKRTGSRPSAADVLELLQQIRHMGFTKLLWFTWFGGGGLSCTKG